MLNSGLCTRCLHFSLMLTCYQIVVTNYFACYRRPWPYELNMCILATHDLLSNIYILRMYIMYLGTWGTNRNKEASGIILFHCVISKGVWSIYKYWNYCTTYRCKKWLDKLTGNGNDQHNYAGFFSLSDMDKN